jgi:hypothetical protein
MSQTRKQEVFEKLQIQKRKRIRVKNKLTTYLNTIFWRKQRLMMRLKMKRNGDEKNGAENYGLVGNDVDEMGLTARTIDRRFRQQQIWE